MRIFIAIQIIRNIGGISASLINLLNNIKDENEITICAVNNYISNDAELPDEVKIIPGIKFFQYAFVDRDLLHFTSKLDKMKLVLSRLLKRLIGVHRVVDLGIKSVKPKGIYDVAIAFSNDIYSSQGNLIAGGTYDYVLKCVDAKKKIAWVHNKPEKCGFTQKICKKIFKDFDAVVNVSKECKSEFDLLAPFLISKSFVVYNMYSIPKIEQKAGLLNPYSGKGLHFVTVGRMYNEQKRHDRILNAIHQLKQWHYSGFDWTFVGDGPDLQSLKDMSLSLGIKDIVSFVGLKTNPFPYIKYADALVLASEYEGLPVTAKESQILGTPTLITNFGSAKEAVRNDCNGMICENSSDGVFEMLKTVLNDPSVLQKYKENLLNAPVTNEESKAQFYSVCR